MAAKLGLVLDCADPEALGEFWSAALGYTVLGGAGNYVMLVDPEGAQPKLVLQRVTETKPGKNRMHFDIEVPDIETEVARLVELGATRVSEGPCREHGSTWILMSDPEGNEFCVCDAGQPASG